MESNKSGLSWHGRRVVVIADFRLPIADLVFGFWPSVFEATSICERSETVRQLQIPKTKDQIGNWQSEIGYTQTSYLLATIAFAFCRSAVRYAAAFVPAAFENQVMRGVPRGVVSPFINIE